MRIEFARHDRPYVRMPSLALGLAYLGSARAKDIPSVLCSRRAHGEHNEGAKDAMMHDGAGASDSAHNKTES